MDNHEYVLQCGWTSLQNTRETNEDAETIVHNHPETGVSFFGVYDGHGGTTASKFASQHLHELFFEEYRSTGDPQQALTDSHLKTNDLLTTLNTTSGSTTATAIVDTKHRKVHAGNLGDSRVVLARKNGETIQMTRDHSSLFDGSESYSDILDMVTDITNLKNLGAVLDEGYIMEPKMINGVNMTRTLGDFYIPGMKEHSIPHIASHHYSKGDVLILACDGVWDSTWTIDRTWNTKNLLEGEKIPRHIREKLMRGVPIGPREEKSIQTVYRPFQKHERATSEIVGYFALEQRRKGVSPQDLSQKIAQKSLNSGDNITVIVVYL